MHRNGRIAVPLKPNLPHDSTVTVTIIACLTRLKSTCPIMSDTNQLKLNFLYNHAFRKKNFVRTCFSRIAQPWWNTQEKAVFNFIKCMEAVGVGGGGMQHRCYFLLQWNVGVMKLQWQHHLRRSVFACITVTRHIYTYMLIFEAC